MNYKKYQKMSFESRVKLAKKLITEYLSKILSMYSYKKVTPAEIKEEMPRSRSRYGGICDNETRRVLIDETENKGYNQLRTLLHEQLEVILGDKEAFDVVTKNNRNTYQFPHSRIDKVVDKILCEIKNKTKK